MPNMWGQPHPWELADLTHAEWMEVLRASIARWTSAAGALHEFYATGGPITFERWTAMQAERVDAIEGTDADAVTLFARAIAGEFDLAVSTRVRHELKKSEPSPELRAYLQRLAPLGAPGRWDVSRWDGGDYRAGSNVAPAGNDLDGDHVEAHRRSGRAFFISRDRRQLKRARTAGCDAMTAGESLARFPAR